LAAFQSDYLAAFLGADYAAGTHGLKKNEPLANCFSIGDTRPVRERVKECFVRHGGAELPWK
jgi:hypothetical protein